MTGPTPATAGPCAWTNGAANMTSRIALRIVLIISSKKSRLPCLRFASDTPRSAVCVHLYLARPASPEVGNSIIGSGKLRIQCQKGTGPFFKLLPINEMTALYHLSFGRDLPNFAFSPDLRQFWQKHPCLPQMLIKPGAKFFSEKALFPPGFEIESRQHHPNPH